MTAPDPDVYERLDAITLANTIMNPDAGEQAHRLAITALSHRGPMERNPRLVQALSAILREPTRWQPDIPEKIIDLFATDPSPEATVAMLDVLPILVTEERSLGTTGSLSMVRGYFYMALATRERDEDIEVWGEFLPTLDTKMLVNIVLDPQAGPLVDAIDPFELLDRHPEPARTEAIFSIIIGATRSGTVGTAVRDAWDLLKRGAHRQAYQDGVEALIQHWEVARDRGHSEHMKGLEAVLAVMDTKPRTAPEKLTGRRPWAP